MFEKIKNYFDEEEEIKLNNSFIEKEPSKRKMRKRINTLEAENELLKETIKDELYKTFMEKLGEPQEIERLRKENTNLRKKIRTLRELVIEDHNGRTRKTNVNARKISK